MERQFPPWSPSLGRNNGSKVGVIVSVMAPSWAIMTPSMGSNGAIMWECCSGLRFWARARRGTASRGDGVTSSRAAVFPSL